MDDETVTGIIAVLTMIVILTVFIGGMMWTTYLIAYAAEDANKECQSKGYDTYETYKRPPFSKDAMGVKCNHIENKQEFVSTGDGPGVQPAVIMKR